MEHIYHLSPMAQRRRSSATGRLLLITLLLFAFIGGAKAQLSGSGTQTDPYIIGSDADWETFAADINAGTNADKYYRLGADINVSTMAGTSEKKFSGTFDGAGYTMTLDLTSDGSEYCAPFRHVDGATIKRVHTTGSVTTAVKYGTGLVGEASNTVNIANSWSSVAIVSSVEGDGTHGGFIGVSNGNTTITNCRFDGVICATAEDLTYSCGGFVGWRNSTLSISNSLYAPAAIPEGKYSLYTTHANDNSATFTRNNSNSVSNCYYTSSLKTAQGTAVGDMTQATLATTLGDAWEVSGGQVVPIMDAKNLVAFGNISGLKAVYNYTGDPIAISYTVTDDDGTALTEDTHYTAALTKDGNNVSTVSERGTYTLTITALSPYSGSLSATFEVDCKLTVYDENTTTNEFVPIYGYYADSKSKCEFIIPKEKISAMIGGTISAMKFYLDHSSTSGEISTTFDVFVKEVSATTLDGFLGQDGATTVFSNTITIEKNASNVELNIPFSSNYVYGGGNLLVGFYQTGSTSSYNHTYWVGEAQSTNTAWGGYASDNSAKQFLPKTTFTYEIITTPTIILPVTATVLTGSTTTLTATTLNVTGTPGITYSSSNNSVATVCGTGTTATVTAVAPGTATITATMTYDGTDYPATCEIIVEDPSYCIPSDFGSNDDCIVRFVLGDIDNETESTSTYGYGDYTNLSTSFDQGATATATIFSGDGSGSHAAAIWIDFNDNYEFETSERVGTTSSYITGGGTGTISLTIPLDAPAGSHRLRVKYEWGNSIDPTDIDPCSSNTSYGEAEDYTIVINALGAYTITCATTTGGTISADKTLADENDVITITATLDTDYFLTALTYTPEGGSAQDIDITSMPYTFTMPAANVTVNATFTQAPCPRPTNLTVSNLTAHSANVSWNSEAANYTVQYSTAAVTGTTLEPVFEDGFENGIGSWTTYAMGYENLLYNWQQYDGTVTDEDNHTGDYVAASRSWHYSDSDQSVDNWLVTPQMTLGDVVKFWVACNDGYRDSYAVYVSTGSNVVTSSSSIGDFVLVKSYAEATGTWTEISVDISAYAGKQGYVAIRHTNYGGDHILIDDFGVYNTFNTYSYGGWTTVSPTTNSCQLTGLSPETLYEVQVQANYGTDGNSAWSIVRFTTPDNSSAPQELASSDITATSATLSWADDKDSYNLRYRKVYYYEDFEGADGIPAGWTTINNSTTAGNLNWQVLHLNNYSGNNSVGSGSYIYQDSGITPDNWLISPQLDLQGTLRVWLSGYGERYSEHFEILLSTTGTSVSDFTATLVADTTTTDSYAEYTADLSSYSGKGYIAIHHFNCSDQNYLCVDDFGIYDSEDWVTLTPNPTTETASLTGLMPNTLYEWQVQGVDYDGNGNNTEWSERATFTTLIFNIELADDDSEKPTDEKNEAILSTYNGQIVNVTLAGRTLWKDGTWNTLYLPFGLTEEQVYDMLENPSALMMLDVTSTDEDDETKKKTRLDGTILYLAFEDATEISPCVPYIIKWDGNNNDGNLQDPVFTGVTIDSLTSVPPFTFEGGEFKGTFDYIQYTETNTSILFLGADNTLYYPQPDLSDPANPLYPSVGACRAYFEFTDPANPVKSYVMNFGSGQTTGLKSLIPTDRRDDADGWYDLSGRKVQQRTSKGLYISHGRKVVVK